MKIIHRIALNVDKKVQAKLLSAGVPLEIGSTVFKISEQDPRWSAVNALLKDHRTVDLLYTEFSKAELRQARYLELVPDWHNGYAQPDNDFGYLSCTYDLSQYCETCGIGRIQNNPFRLKKRPVWGKRSIFQLNWVFDEYFVRPEIWTAVFKPFGIGCIDVSLHKTGEKIENVVQLDISERSELRIGSEQERSTCAVCNREKFSSRRGGFCPMPVSEPDAHMFRSTQYFGSGASAFNLIVMSSELRTVMNEALVKGAKFNVCGD